MLKRVIVLICLVLRYGVAIAAEPPVKVLVLGACYFGNPGYVSAL